MEEERYWLRHPTLRGLVGPYRLDELRAALTAESLPADSYALRDTGLTENDMQASPSWQPVTDVLGLPRPPKPEPTAVAGTPPVPPALAARTSVRAATAYSPLRTAVSVVAVIACTVVVLSTMTAIGTVGHAATAGFVAIALCEMAVEVAVILITAGIVQALLDIADCSLRKDRAQRAHVD